VVQKVSTEAERLPPSLLMAERVELNWAYSRFVEVYKN